MRPKGGMLASVSPLSGTADRPVAHFRGNSGQYGLQPGQLKGQAPNQPRVPLQQYRRVRAAIWAISGPRLRPAFEISVECYGDPGAICASRASRASCGGPNREGASRVEKRAGCFEIRLRVDQEEAGSSSRTYEI
jgi:hypothetical protein